MLRAAIAVAIMLAGGAASANRIVAIAPLSTLGSEDTSSSTKKLTAQLEAAVAGLGDKVITAAQVSEAIKRAKKPHLKACEGEVTCLAELGKLVGAQVVIAGQIGGLGESRVVYLGATDVSGGKELRSTTLSVGGDRLGRPIDDPNRATGAVIQLLDPDRYRGQLRFAIDVGGATIYVNGSKATLSGKQELALPVGTQAVRVTHPEYHDFVRFIDVEFGKTLDVTVAMTQYPIVQRDIQGNPINRDRIVYRDPPLWRRWYIVGPAAIGVVILSGIIVGALVHDVPDAPCRQVNGEKC
ncbi:MAG: PEGA domain-containing protein [Kofleriaceae bacterium]